MCLGRKAEEAIDKFKHIASSLEPFRDAGEEPSDFELSVSDCLKGLEKAVSLGWYNFNTFDYKEYEFNHKLDNGDMNWIIPKRILALSSPTDSYASGGVPPSEFVKKFKDMKIKAIIRLNEKLYSEEEFEREGIKVHDLEFLDGSCPSDVIFHKLFFIANYLIFYNSL